MKRLLVILTFCLAMGMAGFGFSQNQGSKSAPPVKGALASETEAVIGVDELMRHVDRYRGVLLVEGIVNFVLPKDHTLSLIDPKEFKECGVTTCASLQLPVRWGGAMPGAQDLVRVRGQVQEAAGKLIFIAQSLEKVAPWTAGPK
jgi:hypothetical protein